MDKPDEIDIEIADPLTSNAKIGKKVSQQPTVEEKKEKEESKKKEIALRKLAKRLEEEEKKMQVLEKKRVQEEMERQREQMRRRELNDSLHPLSMYWLPRMSLPAICIAHERKLSADGGLNTWKLTLKPICCTTYHYITDVDKSLCEPLNEGLLRQCHDERTVDFAHALIDFAKKYQQEWSDEVRHLSEDVDYSEDSVFIWPGYITDLMEEYRKWSVWRKKAERSCGGKQRRLAYFNLLVEEFDALENEAIADEECESEGEGDKDKRELWNVSRSKHKLVEELNETTGITKSGRFNSVSENKRRRI